MNVMRPLGAPVAVPRRQPLSVVSDANLTRSRRLSRLFTALALVAVCFGLFAVIGLRVMLAQGQGEVQRLQSRVQEEEERQRRLDVEVAGLEAPARIVAAAQERLGMTPPSSVVTLAPASLDDPPATTVPAPRPSTTAAPTPSTRP